MTTYRPIDSKREEFRKYLERAGVMDALTKALVSLYEEAEKPDNALDYVRKHLGDDHPDMAEFVALQAELEDMRAKNQDLEEELTTLRSRVAETENQDAPAEEGAPPEGAPPEGAEPEEPPPPPEEA